MQIYCCYSQTRKTTENRGQRQIGDPVQYAADSPSTLESTCFHAERRPPHQRYQRRLGQIGGLGEGIRGLVVE